MSRKTLAIIILVVFFSSVLASYVGYYLAKRAFLKAEVATTGSQTTSEGSTAQKSDTSSNLPFLQDKTTFDTTKPEVVSVTPLEGAQGVAKDIPVTVKFSKEINPDTLNASTIYVYEQKNQTLLNNFLNFSYNDLNNTLTITFQKDKGDWTATNTISITLTTGILDNFGNPLKETKTWQFSTE